MRLLTLVYAYYDNPGMLAFQYDVWRKYPERHKAHLRVVIVDDASPRFPAVDVPRPEGIPQISIYRAREDIPWHQDAARNLGAHVAGNGWLFLSDMDHVLPAESLEIIEKLPEVARMRFYTFDRWDAGTNGLMLDKQGHPKPHPNTYLMRRNVYWAAGGYDEDFCGVYGTDGIFRKQLLNVARHIHLDNVYVIRYSRDVIHDASTTTLDRREYGGVEVKRAAKERKIAKDRLGKIITLDFQWDKLL